MMEWTKQVCLLTGATGGIGQAIAEQLAANGATLLLHGRNQAALETLAARLPGNPRLICADLNNADGIIHVVDIAKQHKVSLLINNAGVSHFGHITQLDDEILERVINLNLLVPIKLAKKLLPTLSVSNGNIVNIGSAFGSIGFSCHSAYCASKFGLRGFSEALHRELNDSPVSVHYFAPRATDTALNSPHVVAMNEALGNTVDSTDEVAKKLLKQLENNQARSAMGFAESVFAKLNSLFPSLVDHVLAKKLALIKSYAFKHSMETR